MNGKDYRGIEIAKKIIIGNPAFNKPEIESAYNTVCDIYNVPKNFESDYQVADQETTSNWETKIF